MVLMARPIPVGCEAALVVLRVTGRHDTLGRLGMKVLGARRFSHAQDLPTHGCSCSPCGLSAIVVLVARLKPAYHGSWQGSPCHAFVVFVSGVWMLV